MGNSKYLTPQAKAYILEQMLEIGEITTDEVMGIVAPHFIFDPKSAREQQIRRVAHGLMAGLRDNAGNRNCFALQSKKSYINVDRTKDLAALSKLEKNLKARLSGLDISYEKVRRRLEELEGQTSLSDNVEGIG